MSTHFESHFGVVLPLNLNTHPLEGTGTLVYQGLSANGGKLQTTDKQYSAVHFSPQSHPAQSDPSVLLPVNGFCIILLDLFVLTC